MFSSAFATSQDCGNQVFARNLRTCRRCCRTKPVTRDHFNVRRERLSASCKACECSADRARYRANRTEILARKKVIRDRDLVSVAARRRENYLANRERINALQTARNRTDPIRRIRSTVRARFNKIVHAKGLKKVTSWQVIVGYSVRELKAHIEVMLLPGWTWQNYGVLWHIDHKRPVASFDLPRQIRECWALSNLRPLGKMENHRKGSRVPADNEDYHVDAR